MIPRGSNNGPVMYIDVIPFVAHTLQLVPIGFAQWNLVANLQ